MWRKGNARPEHDLFGDASEGPGEYSVVLDGGRGPPASGHRSKSLGSAAQSQLEAEAVNDCGERNKK